MDLIEQFDTWKFLGGIGIFLFAMFALEKSVKDLAGRSFKKFIRKQTRTRFRSILSGTLVTAVLQSSSAVSLMVLAFVGAGIMAMENAIGVILGSNIGTTLTGWIVATVGFKLNLEAFSLVFIGIGGLIIIFLGKSERFSNISTLLVSFGFLFMGLGFMKESVEAMTSTMSVTDIPNYGIFFYLLVGILLTAAIQSSSASLAIILTGLHANLISFESAAAFVIGANIGTTATILLGGIRATQIKKRVAVSHLLFNLFSAIIGLILLWPLTHLIQYFIGSSNENAVMGIALFHTLFNVVGVIAFYPFIRVFSNALTRLLPDKKIARTKYIDHLSPYVFDAAIHGIGKEIQHLSELVIEHNKLILSTSSKNESNLDEKYESLKVLQAEIFAFAAEIQEKDTNEEEGLKLFHLLHSARESLNAAKTLRDVHHNVLNFSNEDNFYLQELIKNYEQHYADASKLLMAMMKEEDHALITKTLSEMLKKLKQDDLTIVNKTMEASRNKQLSDITTSEVLLLNRSYNYSIKLIIQSIVELKLNDEERASYERLVYGH